MLNSMQKKKNVKTIAMGLAVRINKYTWKYDSYYNLTTKVGQ